MGGGGFRDALLARESMKLGRSISYFSVMGRARLLLTLLTGFTLRGCRNRSLVFTNVGIGICRRCEGEGTARIGWKLNAVWELRFQFLCVEAEVCSLLSVQLFSCGTGDLCQWHQADGERKNVFCQFVALGVFRSSFLGNI